MSSLVQERKETDEEIAARLGAAKEKLFEETGEKECEICGAWFKPSTGNQKYCKKCGKKPEIKRKWMDRDVRRSVYVHGNGVPHPMYTFICKECGKDFLYPLEKGKDFCSLTCRTKYRKKHAVCVECGRNLASLGIDVNENIREDFLFCSEKCREKHKWDVARRSGDVAICKNCGKEVIGKERKFCNRACQTEYAKKNAKGKQKTEHTCMHCGKTFLYYGEKKFCSRECYKASLEAIKNGGPKLSEYEKKEYERKQRMKKQSEEAAGRKLKAEEEFFRKKSEKKREKRLMANTLLSEKQMAYVGKNGLCSICRTSYVDCERMQTDFRMSPEGAIFNGSIVVRCPKYTGGKTK